ncbi:uracil-DNA glycosylase [Subdoligranulum variabile]|nr:uracil-DNA glycosylase [Subdoligranulum variabile]UWP68603.1 uracil-DNA glycosylase [Subdoligranulum variabile]
MLLHQQLTPLLDGDWAPFLTAECSKPYFSELDSFVTEAAAARTVYPAPENIFAAFRACPAHKVRVVILGQDPYHEPGQAMGLSFSVPDACKTPPSLKNIFKELESEFGPVAVRHNDLTPWARQGVLLLNTVLTVEQGAAFSHAGHGWETFTRAALAYVAELDSAPLAAILWGKPAQKYAPLFKDASARRPVLILESAHPSPLSAYRGFFGSAPFGKVDAFLQEHGEAPIIWQE